MSEESPDRGKYRPLLARKNIALGAGLGIIFGAAFGNPAIGMIIGACVGVVFDRAVGRRAPK